MRTISALMLVSLLAIFAVPAFAAEPVDVGPFAVTAELSQLADKLTLSADISGGEACEKLILTVTAENTKTQDTATLKSTSPFAYAPNFGDKRRASTQVDADISAWHNWYAADISIQCVQDGAAKRYSMN